MSEQLVIRLGSVPQQSISWLVWAAQQQEVIATADRATAHVQLYKALGGGWSPH